MKTLLISLAFMTFLSGCAARTPQGMENMGSVSEFKRDSGNSTQVSESYGRKDVDIEDADRAAHIIVGVIDVLTK